MSRTLFFYIFKDLIRIFLLASAALAGMMSFGALLRPLTEHGLDGTQVAQMLSFLMPAMTTYSLPVAALFATTMVYGRLSADNELTAVRAAGISHLSIAIPALVMGLMVALVSLLFLCFVVPTFTYKVEKVIYSNLARLVANEIQRTHQVRFGDYTIFAEDAYVPPVDTKQPNMQVVVLEGPMIVEYGKRKDADPTRPEPQETPTPPRTDIDVPKTFIMASEAQVVINRDPVTDAAEIGGKLIGGSGFPRKTGTFEGGIAVQHFGPFSMPSSIQEETKFMDIRRLQEVLREPGKSRRLREMVDELIKNEQKSRYLRYIRSQLNGPARSMTFDTGRDQYILKIQAATMQMDDGDLLITSRSRNRDDVTLTLLLDGETIVAEAREIRISALARPKTQQMYVKINVHQPTLTIGEERIERESFPQELNVPMPEDVRKLEQRTPRDYMASRNISPVAQNRLWRDYFKVTNGVQSELHGRASFAVSCLILVVVGCALGMMFKSGNFLSAFAVSVVPALLCITLIATGQQTCENIPSSIANYNNAATLRLGLSLIWSGNVIVLIIAVVLMGRLQRQ
jgi:lipopolysaccharide export LptBFGC system permease protein LptF